MKSGGHGQENIDYLNALNRNYNIEHTFGNGVRTGNVPTHAEAFKQTGVGQSWFPSPWTKTDIDNAGNFVINNNRAAYLAASDGTPVFGVYNGVKVGVIKTGGKHATTFPDLVEQPNLLGVMIRNPKL
jgi:hypothetical protein